MPALVSTNCNKIMIDGIVGENYLGVSIVGANYLGMDIVGANYLGVSIVGANYLGMDIVGANYLGGLPFIFTASMWLVLQYLPLCFNQQFPHFLYSQSAG